MLKLIGAPTLDDALFCLAKEAAENEARAHNTLIFCEDRLTLLAERAVLKGTGGTFHAEVTTFKRFLSGTQRTLSKEGSVTVLSALLEKHEGSLSCFKKGAAQAVYETIAQLAASRVDAELLKKSAEETEGMLRLKLLDLSFLLEKYNEFLSERNLLDENGYLALLPEKIASGALADTDVFFFCFPSFTGQAREALRAAFAGARSVTGVFLAGRENFYTNEAARIFRAVASEFGGAEVSQLPSSLTGEAAELKSVLFSPDAWGAPAPSKQITRFSCADETAEADTVAALIKKYVAEGKRYQDLAVLVGGEEDFLAVERAFAAHRIPYYADKKRPYSRHPFCRFVFSVLEAAADGVLPEEADDIASSVYFGKGDNYRNYLLKYGGYRGACKREIKEDLDGEAREELVLCRARMLAILSCFRAKAKAANYTEGIRKLWEIVEGERVTLELSEGLSKDEAEFLRIDRLEEFLKETESLVGGESFTAREFCSLLKNGLEALTVSVFPQCADAVFVGDITESKIYRSPVLFCMGLTDALPRVSQDTAVISDGEIDKLKTLGAEITPAIAQVNARAREALALNLCAFTEALYLGCPLQRGGAETTPSELFSYAEQAFLFQPLPDLFPYNCSEYGPALLNYFAMKGAVEGTPADATTLIERYSSLREILLKGGHGWVAVDPDALALDAVKPSVPEAGELYFKGEISPTLLENYFECPYKSFALRALHVAEREERGVLDAADAGTFVHTVLERTARRFNEFGGAEECLESARAEAEALIHSPQFSSLADTAAGAYAGARLIEEAAAVTAEAYRQLTGSMFRVREAEKEVRLEALRLRGKADRVDAADALVRVIDYKTGHIDDSPTAYYTGRKLQLELYLNACAEGGVAAGAFYFPASSDFTRADEAEGRFRMRGFFCSDPEILTSMDPAREEGKKSAYFEGGGRTEKGMPRETFEDFLTYSVLVSDRAEGEMRGGNVTPSPYDGACERCKLKGMCGFVGVPRKEPAAKCGEIAKIVRDAEEGGDK